MIDSQTKTTVSKDFRKHDKDTGSAEVQVSVLTARIKELTEHVKIHKKDHHSRRGLLQMVGQRKKLLGYLQKNDAESYRNLVAKLGLRR